MKQVIKIACIFSILAGMLIPTSLPAQEKGNDFPVEYTTEKDQKNEESISGKKQLYKIIVTGKLRETTVFDSTYPANLIDKKQIDKKIPFSMAAIFAGEEGVDVSTTGPNSVRPMIRGLLDDRILILLNNIRISEQRGGGNHILSVDPSQIESVEIIRGPASVLYGTNAIGGVMNIIPRQAERITEKGYRIGFENSTSYDNASNGWKNSTIAETGVGGFNVFGQYIYINTDNIQTPDGELMNSFCKGFKAIGSANYVWGNGFFAAYYYHSQTDIGIPNYNTGQKLNFKESHFDPEKHNMLVINYEQREVRGPLDRINVDASYQLHNRHFSLVNPANTAFDVKGEIMLDIATWTANPRTVITLGSNIITTGINFFREDATSDRVLLHVDPDDGSFIASTSFDGVGVIPDSNRTGLGFFLQDEIGLSRKFIVTPGARWDVIHVESMDESGHPIPASKENDTAFSGNIGFLFKASNKINLIANIGRAFRAPTLLERFFHGPHQSTTDRGNPDLDPEISYNADVGIKLLLSRLSGSAHCFYNHLTNYIKQYDSGMGYYTWDNVSRARIYGGELSWELNLIWGFSVFNTLTYIRAEDIDANEDLPMIPPLKTNYGIRYKNRFFNSHKFYLETRGTSVAKQNNAAPTENETKGYTIFSVYAGITTPYLNIALAVENIGNKSYHDHLSRITWINEQPERNYRVNVTLKY